MSTKKQKDIIQNDIKTLVITNEKIINFYNKNKLINFEQVNLLYIELFENINYQKGSEINMESSTLISNINSKGELYSNSKDNVKVVIRVRPLNEREKSNINSTIYL